MADSYVHGLRKSVLTTFDTSGNAVEADAAGGIISEPDYTLSGTESTITLSVPARKVTISVILTDETAAGSQDSGVVVCFNPTNAVTRNVWLTETLSGPRGSVGAGKTRSFVSATPITTIGIKSYGTITPAPKAKIEVTA